MKPLSDPINKQDPGWALVSQWIKDAKNMVEVLPKDSIRANAALLQAQLTTRSPLGAVVYETGGILVDHGWIRILESGSERLNRSLMDWNAGKSFITPGAESSFLLIADDVLGGFYAINAEKLAANEIGKVFYLAPDTLSWESTTLGYSDFLIFCFSGDLTRFYKNLRWKGWEKDTNNLDGTKGINCYPFLWTSEGKDINKVSRNPVPIEELWSLKNDIKDQLDGKH